MSRTGIDIAWDRPSIAQIKATGATWVGRYHSTDPTKNITAAEVRDYHAASLDIITVWETTTSRATEGYQAGIDDAHAADAQRRAVGLPDNHVIHFAVDEDTDWAAVSQYYLGIEHTLGIDRVGSYGGIRVINGAHAAGIKYLWQADAWSYGAWSPYATIRQVGGTCLNGNADYDQAMTADFGQYPRPSTTPTPPPNTTPKDDDMAYEKDIKAGFGCDATGKLTDTTKSTVIALPPKNGTMWGGVFVSFGSDFGDAKLRIAILGLNKAWRVFEITVPSQGIRVNVPINDGDQKISVVRVPTSATDKADAIPVSALVECFRK